MFKPGLKSPAAIVSEQAESLLQSDLFPELLIDAPNIIMILNRHRQVVYLNRNPVSDNDALYDEALGQRPGECLGCINIDKGELGCASSAFCRVCGFNLALQDSEAGRPGQDECNIALKSGASLTLSVSTRPFAFKGESYIFCALEDVSEKKRREMLEGIFLHDILNTAAVLSGLGDVYDELKPQEIKLLLKDVSANISDEVQSYRLISHAETQSLQPTFAEVDLGELGQEVARSLQSMQKFRHREIRIELDHARIVTERTFLRRVLINMLKNALEASGGNDLVGFTCRCNKDRKEAVFSVTNPQYIPHNDQLKLFQKSFSTKGRGRGWGTYSIKVLTEKYLQGDVGFTSCPEEGTTFKVRIPSLDKESQSVK